jgi:hypothetical protein
MPRLESSLNRERQATPAPLESGFIRNHALDRSNMPIAEEDAVEVKPNHDIRMDVAQTRARL